MTEFEVPSGLGFFTAHDATGDRLASVSDSLVALAGVSREELLSKHRALRSLVASEDLNLLQVVIDHAAAQGLAYQCRYRLQRPDGRSIAVREYGEVRGGVLRAALLDQTDIVMADVSPPDSDDWYRTFFENANDAMLVIEQGCIIECNGAAVQLFGRPRGMLLGKSPAEMSPPTQPGGRDTQELANELLALALAGRPQRFEWEHTHADGARIFAEVTVRRAREAGADVVVAVVRDVTERRGLELALRASERTFREAFRRAPFGASIADIDGAYLEVNDAFVELFGVSRERLIGLDSVEAGLLTEEAADALASRFLAQGTLVNQEIDVQTSTGRKTVVLSSSRVEVDDEIYLLTTMVDISALKTAQRALVTVNEGLERRVQERTSELERAIAERERAMSQLVHSEKLAGLGSVVAGVAHELNTPLGNALVIATSFVSKVEDFRAEFETGSLRRSTLTGFVESATDGALLLAKNLTRAHELITSFKHVAVDQTSMRRRRFDLRETVQEVLSTLGHVFKNSSHTVLVEIESGIELDSYPGPLQQVLTNLLNNSLVHAFEGREGGTILVRASKEPTCARLTYEDNGRGINAAAARRVFEPFFTTKLGQGGSGLGLYLVYNIVTAVLGGAISLHHARPGVRFEIVLPLVAPDSNPYETPSEFPPAV